MRGLSRTADPAQSLTGVCKHCMVPLLTRALIMMSSYSMPTLFQPTISLHIWSLYQLNIRESKEIENDPAMNTSLQEGIASYWQSTFNLSHSTKVTD